MFQQERIPMHRKPIKSEINSVHLSDDLEISPAEEVVCNEELREWSYVDTIDVLLEQNYNAEGRHSILVGRVVSQIKDGPMPLLIANPGPTTVKLREGIKLPIAEPITQIKRVVFAVHESEESTALDLKSGLEAAIENISRKLQEIERTQLIKLLEKKYTILSTRPSDLGRTVIAKHEIDTWNTRPIKQAPRRLPHWQSFEVNKEIDRMVDSGLVKPSQSPWASNIVVVRKKDGSIRLCVDYRKVNAVTRKDAHPLPRIEDLLETLLGSKYFSTLDLASGYHQVEIAEQDQEKTAFVTPSGLYEYQVMPFGLCNAPATFQRLMTVVFAGMLGNTCLAYIDDIIVFGISFQQHQERLEQVFWKLR